MKLLNLNEKGLKSLISKRILLLILVLGAVIIAGCSSGNTTGDFIANNDGNTITVYKSPSCGCCSLYVKHLQKESGLKVQVIDVPDVSPIKDEKGVPSNLRSCHTTIIGDYFVEGHVPFEAINKLIEEKPDIAGIAMSGMPSGSPGMPGTKKGPFVIYAVNKDGSFDKFMTI